MKIRPENYMRDVPPVQDEVQTNQFHGEISMNVFASQPAVLTQDDLQGSSQTAMYIESTQGSSQPTMLLSQMSSTMLMRMMEEVKMVTSICCMSFSCPSVTNILFFCRVLNQPTPISLLGLCQTHTSLVQTNYYQGHKR